MTDGARPTQGPAPEDDVWDVSIVLQNPDDGSQISTADQLTDRLRDRMTDVRQGIRAGTAAALASIRDLPSASGWSAQEVEVDFSLTLKAEAGVVISKIGAEAALGITVRFARSAPDPGEA
ncbi:CU044_2847 family protein [Streptomyces sp. AC602_WCS936]|uniref:CU044_2847 family protein n=1 Tax=Streptomyces sp. AC602_WCS936 TaxID=2823685 RepID=UPI001C2712E2|nr:CU044_2847 family protein [Streptomyces sp. AC602_WCS936]